MSAASSGVFRDIRRYFAARPTAASTPTSTVAMGSADEEDPLSAASARLSLPELQLARRAAHAAAGAGTSSTPPGRSRIAVVLSASPSRGKPKTPPPATLHRAGVSKAVTADAASRFRRQWTVKKETPVPVPKIPNWPPRAPPPASTNSAPPSAKGRPKGWKAGMSYAVMRGKPPPDARVRVRQAKAKATPAGVVKRRGRPPKAPSPAPCEIYHGLAPQYVEFLCEWAGCPAALHNLDTLRRHVYAVHGRGPARTCRWGKCASREPARAFADADAFGAHVEEAHLVPFAWHVGDGPRNGAAGKGPDDVDGEVPDYLRDAQGTQVTPSVRDQEVEDLATWRMNRRRLKELLVRRDAALPDEEEEEEEGGDDAP